jgi:hypothetical protein
MLDKRSWRWMSLDPTTELFAIPTCCTTNRGVLAGVRRLHTYATFLGALPRRNEP